MLSWRPRRVVALMLLLLALAACKKESGTELPSDFRPRSAAVDVDKLAVPALFAHIPADSPYVVASFEAVPLAYLAKFKRGLGPALGRAFDKLRTFTRDGAPSRWIDAIADELDGKWNAKGIESLGFSANPRFAAYGQGILPVLRVEIADGKVLLATLERVAARAGATLPPLENRHGRDFWRIELPGDDGAIIAIHDKQLVAAVGPRSAIADVLPQILGAQQPSQSMADGKLLKELIAKHRLGPQLVGFLDGKRMTAAAIALADRPPPKACIAEIDRLTANVPRLVFGYSEITDKRISGAAIVELAPALVGELKAMKAVVPGLGAALADDPLFAMGGGIDLARAQRAGKSIAYALHDLAEACDVAKMARSAAELRDAMSQPLPGSLAKITGGVIAVDAIELPGGGGGRQMGIPEKLDAFAMMTAADPKGVLDEILGGAPRFVRNLGIKADGKLHEIEIPGGFLPFEVHAGVGDAALVVTAGARGKKLGDKALGYSGGTAAPFLAGSIDYGKLLELTTQLGGTSGGDAVERELNEAMAKLLGRTTFTIDASDHGLAWWFSMELK